MPDLSPELLKWVQLISAVISTLASVTAAVAATAAWINTVKSRARDLAKDGKNAIADARAFVAHL